MRRLRSIHEIKHFAELFKFLKDNDFSTIVDLEEEKIEVSRFIKVFDGGDICVLEVDKRFE